MLRSGTWELGCGWDVDGGCELRALRRARALTFRLRRPATLAVLLAVDTPAAPASFWRFGVEWQATRVPISDLRARLGRAPVEVSIWRLAGKGHRGVLPSDRRSSPTRRRPDIAGRLGAGCRSSSESRARGARRGPNTAQVGIAPATLFG